MWNLCIFDGFNGFNEFNEFNGFSGFEGYWGGEVGGGNALRMLVLGWASILGATGPICRGIRTLSRNSICLTVSEIAP